MINISPILDGSKLCKLFDTAWYGCSLRAHILVPTQVETTYQVGEQPVSSRKSALGNRNCSHMNWQGSIVDTPACMSTSISTYRPPNGTTYQTGVWYTSRLFFTDKDSEEFTPCELLFHLGGSGKIDLPYLKYWGNQGLLDVWSFYEYQWLGSGTLLYQYYSHTYRASTNRHSYSISCNKCVFDDQTGPVDFNIYKHYFKSVSYIYDWPALPAPDSLVYDYTVGFMDIKTFTGYGSSADVIKIDQFDLAMASRWIERVLPEEDENLWGDLCQTAVQNAHSLNVNSLEFIRDLWELKDTVRSLVSLLRGKISTKTLSQLWLSMKYGLRLTVKDTSKIIKSTDRSMKEYAKTTMVPGIGTLGPKKWKWNKPYRYVRSMDWRDSIFTGSSLAGTSVSQEYHYKVYYDPMDPYAEKFILKLIDWDLFPTMQNLWDLIPLSFVLDWFVDFENYFDIVDQAWYATRLHVLEVVYSTKSTIPSVPLTAFLPVSRNGRDLYGDVSLAIYKRSVKPYLDIPRLRLETPEEFHNFAELAAIVVTTVK